jgi:hypothetical protein
VPGGSDSTTWPFPEVFSQPIVVPSPTTRRILGLRLASGCSPGRRMVGTARTPRRVSCRRAVRCFTPSQSAVRPFSREPQRSQVRALGRTLFASGGDAIYVFTEPAGGWAGTIHETAKLTAPDGARLGRSGHHRR